MPLLKIVNLSVSANKKQILKNINISINEGERHVILGPNGQGKTTLFHAIMGSPKYKIDSGEIWFKEKKLNDLSPDERSKLGIFLSWQNPVEIMGVPNLDYLRLLVNSHQEKKISTFSFYKLIETELAQLKMPYDFKERYLNVNFSGGEKKRFEILQLLLTKPSLVLLDEIDSGIDVDSLTLIKNILQQKKINTFLVISHHEAFLKDLKIDYVHVLINGSIIKIGSKNLITKIYQEGFSFLRSDDEG